MLWCDMVKTWWDINCCMRWSCFWNYRQLAGALWLSLYCIRCKCHVIALHYRYAIAIVAKTIVGETTMWRHIDKDQDDGIMVSCRWRWRSWWCFGDGDLLTLKSGTMVKVSLNYVTINSNYDWRSPWDGSFREDQDGYENGLKRSSDAKVMTSSDMIMLTPD